MELPADVTVSLRTRYGAPEEAMTMTEYQIAFTLWFIKLIELYVVLHLKLGGAVARLQSQSTWVSNREQHL